MGNLPTPLSRVELYLAKACGMDVTVPEEPMSRLEQFLAIIAGDDSVEMPTPMSLTEQWLAYVLGVTPDPLLAVEGACLIGAQKVDVRYFAVAAGMPGATLPDAPQNRAEMYWAHIAGNPPTPGILKYVTGKYFYLTDVVSGIEELQYVKGDTLQNGEPTPDTPVPVQVVTGAQTVTISNGVDSEDFTISLGSIELCKLGDYQDYIYKSGDDWYVHKATGKFTFGGSTISWSSGGEAGAGYYAWWRNTSAVGLTEPQVDENNTPALLATFGQMPYGSGKQQVGFMTKYSTTTPNIVFITDSSIISSSDLNTALSGSIYYYALATPTDTKITDATLVSQLDVLNSAPLPKPIANITVSATGTNLEAILTIAYYGSDE